MIKITPEILEKYGFVKDNYGIFEKVRDDAPYISGCSILFWCKFYNKKGETLLNICMGEEFGSLVEICDIEYLHEMKRLHLAITKKKLLINKRK